MRKRWKFQTRRDWPRPSQRLLIRRSGVRILPGAPLKRPAKPRLVWGFVFPATLADHQGGNTGGNARSSRSSAPLDGTLRSREPDAFTLAISANALTASAGGIDLKQLVVSVGATGVRAATGPGPDSDHGGSRPGQNDSRDRGRRCGRSLVRHAAPPAPQPLVSHVSTTRRSSYA